MEDAAGGLHDVAAFEAAAAPEEDNTGRAGAEEEEATAAGV